MQEPRPAPGAQKGSANLSERPPSSLEACLAARLAVCLAARLVAVSAGVSGGASGGVSGGVSGCFGLSALLILTGLANSCPNWERSAFPSFEGAGEQHS